MQYPAPFASDPRWENSSLILPQNPSSTSISVTLIMLWILLQKPTHNCPEFSGDFGDVPKTMIFDATRTAQQAAQDSAGSDVTKSMSEDAAHALSEAFPS
jgi:hypothetical protein